jgi:hypothetical protein
MARPKIINKRKAISLTIDNKLDIIINKFCEDKKITKSKYIESLIRKNNII